MTARESGVGSRESGQGTTPLRRDSRFPTLDSRRVRKYVAAFRVSLLNTLAYPAELWLRTIFVFFVMFVFSALWHVTFEETGRDRLGGLDLTQMLWYLAITESILLSRPRDAVRIDAEVRSGSLAYDLTRPYNYLLYRFFQVWGERLPRFLVTLLIAGALATVFAGGVGVSASGVLAGIPALGLALSIDFLFVIGISLTAFWIEDTTSLLFIYDRCLMILGGMLLPLELFPGALETVARVLPFAAIVYAPARTFVDPDPARLALLLLQQAATLVLAALAAGAFFRYATRRLQANGG